jgi:hypothetical protein
MRYTTITGRLDPVVVVSCEAALEATSRATVLGD